MGWIDLMAGQCINGFDCRGWGILMARQCTSGLGCGGGWMLWPGDAPEVLAVVGMAVMAGRYTSSFGCGVGAPFNSWGSVPRLRDVELCEQKLRCTDKAPSALQRCIDSESTLFQNKHSSLLPWYAIRFVCHMVPSLLVIHFPATFDCF